MHYGVLFITYWDGIANILVTLQYQHQIWYIHCLTYRMLNESGFWAIANLQWEENGGRQYVRSGVSK